jgi:hypothetical protein
VATVDPENRPDFSLRVERISSAVTYAESGLGNRRHSLAGHSTTFLAYASLYSYQLMPANSQFEVFEDAEVPPRELRQICRVVQAARGHRDPLLPVPVRPIPPEIESLLRDPLPSYKPHIRVDYQEMKPLFTGEPLQLFLLLFNERCLSLLIEHTNIYAQSHLLTET